MNNKLSEYISARFWGSHFYVEKDKFSMNFPQKLQNNSKALFKQYVAHFVEKNSFC